MELFGRRQHRVNDQENSQLTINIALVSTLLDKTGNFLKRASVHFGQAMKALPVRELVNGVIDYYTRIAEGIANDDSRISRFLIRLEFSFGLRLPLLVF